MRPSTFLPSVLILAASTWSTLDACGDKFLLVGRGTSFQRAYASMYPGTIVVYLPGIPRAAERAGELQKALARAGHRVSVVSDGARLGDLLAKQQTDIVIAETREASGLQSQLDALAASPTLVYVADPRQKDVPPTAVPVLKTNDKGPSVLNVIEGAMKARARAGTRVKRG